MGIDRNEARLGQPIPGRGSGGGHITVDVSGPIKMLDDLEKALSDNKRRALRYGVKLMNQEIQRAFTRKASPNGWVPWPLRYAEFWGGRKYRWPLLEKSGDLRKMVKAGYGLNRKRSRYPALFGKIATDNVNEIKKAAALNWGRRKLRKMPAREFFGMSRYARQKFIAYWKQQIKAAVD